MSCASRFYRLSRALADDSKPDRTKIILARSPAHLHLVTAEFLKSGRTSLTRAIKDNFSGTIAQLLLYAVENGKKDRDAPGICQSSSTVHIRGF